MIKKLLILISNFCLKLAGVSKKNRKNYILYGTFNTFGDTVLRIEQHFVNSATIETFVSVYDLREFLQACRELHHYPGINPHSRSVTSKLANIKIFKPHLTGPYWYTTPGLSLSVSQNIGAKTMEFRLFRDIKPEELAPDASNWSEIGTPEPAPAA